MKHLYKAIKRQEEEEKKQNNHRNKINWTKLANKRMKEGEKKWKITLKKRSAIKTFISIWYELLSQITGLFLQCPKCWCCDNFLFLFVVFLVRAFRHRDQCEIFAFQKNKCIKMNCFNFYRLYFTWNFGCLCVHTATHPLLYKSKFICFFF